MNIIVSIIIPCFNAGIYISEAINSCLIQASGNIEIIVVDDGSTDQSRVIIESFGDRIVTIFQRNMGGCAARNRGLQAARGKYIKFLDADDYLEKDIIEKQLDHFRETGKELPVAVYGDFKTVDAKGRFTAFHRQPDIKDNNLGLATLIDTSIITTSPLYRRDDLVEARGFNESLTGNQEHELNIRLFLAGVSFRHYSDIVFSHRNYSSGTRISCRNWPEKDPLFMWRLIDHYRNLLFQNKIELREEIASAMATRLASGGRSVVRAGHSELAEQYFSEALKICPGKKFRIGNRYRITKFYLALKRILGLPLTERIYYSMVNVKHNLFVSVKKVRNQIMGTHRHN